MMNYTVSKDMSANAVKNAVKDSLVAEFVEFLTAKYGAENVATVRVGTASGSKNTLAVRVGTVNDDGVFDLCATIDVTAKEWLDRYSSKSGKLWRSGFDFATAKQAYDDYLADKAQKAADAAAKKEKKIAADAAARAKAKANADTE